MASPSYTAAAPTVGRMAGRWVSRNSVQTAVDKRKAMQENFGSAALSMAQMIRCKGTGTAALVPTAVAHPRDGDGWPGGPSFLWALFCLGADPDIQIESKES